MSLRILICVDAFGVGGKERQAVELIRGLASSPEIDSRIVCFDGDDFYLNDLTAAGIRVEFIPRRVRWDIGIFRRLQRRIDAFRPHVIHTNGLVSSFYALPLAKRRGVPLINGSIRNAFANGGIRWNIEKLLLDRSDYRVANSHAGLRSRGLSEVDRRNLVIHNGFDFTRVERAVPDVRSEAAGVTPPGTTVVGMVAEFNQYKDYRTLIEAARIVSRKRDDILFLTVGNGETLETSRRLADGLANVRFLGKRKDVEAVVAGFDIGVLCSFIEGLSNSIMEYMALGKPVVATDGVGTRELVADGETGLLVGQSDAFAVAAAIEYLTDHKDVARRMGQAGRTKLRDEFSLSRMVEETIALYNRAAATGRNRSELGDYPWRAAERQSTAK